jgi:hypothetical protein
MARGLRYLYVSAQLVHVGVGHEARVIVKRGIPYAANRKVEKEQARLGKAYRTRTKRLTKRATMADYGLTSREVRGAHSSNLVSQTLIAA